MTSTKCDLEAIAKLTRICYLDREGAIQELAKVRAQYPKDVLIFSAKQMSVNQRLTIADLVDALNRRRDIQEYRGFRLGQKVRYVEHHYPTLAGAILTIVEFDDPWVICIRDNGYYAPGTTIEDLEAIDV